MTRRRDRDTGRMTRVDRPDQPFEPSVLELVIYAVAAVIVAAFVVFSLISQEMPADWYPTVTTGTG